MFPLLKFNQSKDITEVKESYILWYMFYEIFKKDIHIGANLKNTLKRTYTAAHLRSNKQNVSLSLPVFDEITSAAIKNYYTDRLDAENFLSLFYEIFVMSNSKNQFNTSNGLGNSVIPNDSKTEFLSCAAYCVETWSISPVFTLTKETSHAVITPLGATSYLLKDLPNENYNYIVLSRLQSDLIERHFRKYRQMSGGIFLVCLREVNNSEKK